MLPRINFRRCIDRLRLAALSLALAFSASLGWIGGDVARHPGLERDDCFTLHRHREAVTETIARSGNHPGGTAPRTGPIARQFHRTDTRTESRTARPAQRERLAAQSLTKPKTENRYERAKPRVHVH